MSAVGRQFSGYVIEGVLGEGGMGTVYEARQLSLNRKVALKVLNEQVSADPSFRERFRHEGLLQAEIDHPNIVPVYDTGEAEGSLFLVMRLIRGPTLRQLIEDGALTDARTVALLKPIAEALDAAHEAGLIHRDVKPANILVDGRDVPYLADFGLTRRRTDPGFTKTGQFVGTVDYIAPEQISGGVATSRSDVYALGGVLMECLTGRPPFDGEVDAAVLHGHLQRKPSAVSERRSELPTAIDAVVERALAKEPGDRYETARELLAAAAEALQQPADDRAAAGRGRTTERSPRPGAPAAAPPLGQPQEKPSPRRRGVETEHADSPAGAPGTRRRRWTTGGVLLGVSALPALALGFALNPSSPPERPAEASSSVASATMRLDFGSPWRLREKLPDVPGMGLGDPIALSYRPDAENGWLVGGVTDATGPALMRPQLVERLAEPPPVPERVRLGDLEALRYAGVRHPGVDAPMTVYATATTSGVATIACTAGRACDPLVSGLELTRGRPFALEPSSEHAARMDAVLQRLESDRSKSLRRLRAAAGPMAQAAAADDLAAAYEAAASALGRVELGPAAAASREVLVSAMTQAADRYDAMGRAAARRSTRGRRAAYEDARRGAIRAEQRLGAATGDLDRLGYRVAR